MYPSLSTVGHDAPVSCRAAESSFLSCCARDGGIAQLPWLCVSSTQAVWEDEIIHSLTATLWTVKISNKTQV
ncbi:hypothetical protein E2C01_019785 [Portunus trituberculatus]|uniref:Uncharacterized protein n=1 Tax=Portunus trituberculatus TaxID=210409 RepID=A0A5B7DZT7_PORTR|nr:hypothetical protein [Portunus trituberculatus]